MFGFKKKVSVQSFWQPRLEGMFSGKNYAGWDYLQASFHDPVLNAVQADVFYTHMQPMTIEIVSMVITKSCSMATSMESRIFVDDFLKTNSHQNLIPLLKRYNSAFGSSSTDGIRKIIEAFSEDISNSRLEPQTVEGFYRILYGLTEQIFKLLGEVKLVP